MTVIMVDIGFGDGRSIGSIRVLISIVAWKVMVKYDRFTISIVMGEIDRINISNFKSV